MLLVTMVKPEASCIVLLDDNEKTRRMNIAKVCEIMAWGDKNIGILSEEGYSVPVKLEIEQIGQTAVFEDKDLVDSEEPTEV